MPFHSFSVKYLVLSTIVFLTYNPHPRYPEPQTWMRRGHPERLYGTIRFQFQPAGVNEPTTLNLVGALMSSLPTGRDLLRPRGN
jgi:hypothetical protein